MNDRISRRRFLTSTALAAAGLGLAAPRRVLANDPFDIVVHGGTLLDGNGGPGVRADLGIAGDTIRALGRIAPEQGRRVLDAAGLHVCPGFIDMHSHSDDSILRYPGAESRIMQGITTEVTGNCGESTAPLFGRSRAWRAESLRRNLGVEASWSDVGSYFDELEARGLAVNHALLLGQGSLRESVVGEDNRPATPDELAALLRAVEDGLDQGAWGLSTGLEYAPGIFTPTEEIVELAAVTARHGGLYASHIRNEETGLLEAVDEALLIGRRTGAKVQISHLKAAGRTNWNLQEVAIDRIERARRDGVDVRADAYPYTAYSTGLTILLPAWAREGGVTAMLQRLADAPTRERVRGELAEHIAIDPGGPELIRISAVTTDVHRRFVGRTLADVAAAWSTDAASAAIDLLRYEEGSVAFVGFAMSDENVERVLSHPLVMLGTDGNAMAPAGPAEAWKPHPRSYGSSARMLGHYARERGLFDVGTAIHKMTAMPADHLGLRDRGRLENGKRADLVVLDAAGITDRATFDDPHRYPVGIHHVMVNGELVVENGVHRGVRPGRVLRRA